MAKIILEFDSVEEDEEARTALDGGKWKSSMWELDQELRNRIKYDENLPDDVHKALEGLREKIRDILYSNGLQIE